ncbi:MAG: cell division protein FtsL [Gammaproteobacteria bacterium]|nr:cell division protein FtsL [Gammaproteobacteria bacterium]
MSRTLLIVILGAMVMISAIMVADVRHKGRQRYADLNKLERTIDEALYQWTQLLLERGSQASLPRIEQIAIGDLQMRKPSLTEIEVFDGR